MELLQDKNYKIVKELGKGGMSTIYLAQDIALERYVAIKLLHPALSLDPKNRERLKREALAIARLDHPNIIHVYNYIEEGDQSCIVMEYINGTTLSEFIEKSPIKYIEISLMIFLDILEGIHYSHEHKIIHRDLKPENIMVSETGQIKITDFGIASILGEYKSLTTTGSIMGSPMFMSPEHLSDLEIDHQSDIFSLGIILYYLLTMEFPFKGKNTGQLLSNISHCKYIHPQQINSSIPNSISKIVEKMLSADKKQRYNSAIDIAKDIKNYFKEISFDFEIERVQFFKNPENYQKNFKDRIIFTYLKKGQNLYQKRQKAKAMHYINLVLQLDPENKNAQNIMKKGENRGLIQKILIIFVILSFLLSSSYIFFKKVKFNKKTINNIILNEKDKNGNNTIDSNNTTQNSSSDTTDNKNPINKNDENSSNTTDSNSNDNNSSDSNNTTQTNNSDTTDNKNSTNKNDENSNKTTDSNGAPKEKIISKSPKKIKFGLPIKITPKAASIKLNDKFYSYANAQFITINSNQKYKLTIESKGCVPFEQEIFYLKPVSIPLIIRLNWEIASIEVINSQKGDIFINNKYKSSNEKYIYRERPSSISNGKIESNIKIVKDKKLLLEKTVSVNAGEKEILNVK
ncbi:protein kinase [bacterium]|nr:protein kinase [bacterium]